jgi:hypothetical protein
MARDRKNIQFRTLASNNALSSASVYENLSRLGNLEREE